jgi:LuxR family maltose regulon positive regulatory protein
MAVVPSHAVTDPLQQALPSPVVHRPGLERRLDDVAPGGLGLLVASAGSGKSVLLRQWSSARPDLRIAALALTSRHEDAVVLARDLVHALRSAAPRIDAVIGERVRTGGSALGDELVDTLLGSLAGLTEHVVLVLEDAHVLSSRAVVGDLGRLLTSLPDTTRALVSTRRDLPWPLHRVRLADKLVEIRGADLAFRDGAAGELVENVSHRTVPEPLVRRLVDRTEGWAVGLQLAAISLRTSPDPAAFVDSFAGSDHLVAEYLLDEVIEQQEPEVRRFLLRTSVLEWLSAEQCDAVTGEDNGRAMLDELYRRSMFLIPIDRSAETYRYHHLFAEVLRYRLRLEDPGAGDLLHHRAAQWLLRHGHEEEAVEHLIAAKDPRGAFEVISTVGHRLFERGESATLVRWLSSVGAGDPDGAADVDINLLAAHLGADDAVAATETYRRILRRADLTLGERSTASALYGILVFRGLAPEIVLEVSGEVRDALPHLAASDVVDFLGIGGRDSIEAIIENDAGLALFFLGDLERAGTALERVRTLPGLNYPLWKVFALGSLSLVRAWQGHCTEAVEVAQQAIEEARSFGVVNHQALAHAHLAMALVHLDRVELEPAENSLAESWRHMGGRMASVTYFDLYEALQARLAAAREGPLGALRLLRSPAASGSEAPVLRDGRRALRVRLLVGIGDLAGARAVLDGVRHPTQLAPGHIDVALATGDVATARQVLDAWRPSPDDLRALVRRRLREFLVLRAEGDHHAAETSLTEAVAMARADRLKWPFLEVPAALSAARRGLFRSSWLANDGLWDIALHLEPRLQAQASLVEPLTERELAVLAYLPGRMRNQEIADDLFLSINTVKTHLANIYRKLGVTERNEAVERATTLGLL